MKSYKVIFEDGNVIYTSMNATLEEATKYYVGKKFQFGDTAAYPKDKLIKAIKVLEITQE